MRNIMMSETAWLEVLPGRTIVNSNGLQRRKYYLIDMHTAVEADASDTSYPKASGRHGRHWAAVPELADDSCYDPFCVDIYLIGHMLSQEFLVVSLVYQMTPIP